MEGLELKSPEMTLIESEIPVFDKDLMIYIMHEYVKQCFEAARKGNLYDRFEFKDYEEYKLNLK
ncbi:MAG: hypothetical protein HGA35_04345 [Erysipelotrichaceae bacterium]|nr:hypothetical protein [Erysipelotrichaceae bacterium]